MSAPLRAPFPWFGGKSRAAGIVWDAFGNVPNYVEPFAGSLAVLLGRPHAAKIETVNDRDCYLSNFWRALQADPGALARAADWPVNEADLHARHRWLVDQAAFRERIMTDPEYFDVKVAGWWVWGLCQWIGSGWCAGATPRKLPLIGGTKGTGINRRSLSRKIQDISGAHGGSGRGVHRSGLSRQMPDLSGDSGAAGRGVHRSGLKQQIPFVSRPGNRVLAPPETLQGWFAALADRLRRVRVCCGDWSRILGPSPTVNIGVTAVFLDPSTT